MYQAETIQQTLNRYIYIYIKLGKYGFSFIHLRASIIPFEDQPSLFARNIRKPIWRAAGQLRWTRCAVCWEENRRKGKMSRWQRKNRWVSRSVSKISPHRLASAFHEKKTHHTDAFRWHTPGWLQKCVIRLLFKTIRHTAALAGILGHTGLSHICQSKRKLQEKALLFSKYYIHTVGLHNPKFKINSK